LVSDPGVADAGWTGSVTESLDDDGVGHTTCLDVTPNPRVEEVMRAAESYRTADCDGLVAVGGGSPIDCAKGIAVVVSNNRDIRDFEGVDEIPRPMPPLICIPTTAGTGADVSQFAIFSDRGRRVKITVISKAVVPDVSLIDPETTTTMDPFLTASTGLDALTHAIEAFVSNASSPITDLFALEAIRLVAGELIEVLDAPEDLRHRDKMMRASLFAGLAFSSASLGVVHAMAHSLGGAYDLAHGECNSLLLEHAIGFNFETTPDRYREVAAALGDKVSGVGDDEVLDMLLERLRDLRCRAGITGTLGELGVTQDRITDLAEAALSDPCMATNPRAADLGDIEQIYVQAL
jgi:alcohol dehydrogenase class IV